MPVQDIVIVGGGIVGLATALALVERLPGAGVVVLEKEPELARHQTGRNSGVIHSGLYYRPGSLKARTCVAGARLLIEFCQAHGIPHRITGKLVVAVEPEELPRLEWLRERGAANGVPGLALVGPEEIRELEPHARGIRGLHVPGTGVVDYRAVAAAIARLLVQQDAKIRTSARLLRAVRRQGRWTLATTAGDIRAQWLVTCSGLQADRVAACAGARPESVIVPFRGDYYDVAPSRATLVRAMIYPVPDPALPFLGIHFTRGLDGRVHVGPSAVLAGKREGYGRADLSLRDMAALACAPRFWRMARAHWRTGLEELARAWSLQRFVHAAQRLVPELASDDLVPAPSGVRAQAVDRAGRLLDDFVLLETPGAVHALNVPSPAATASLRIGQLIAERVVAARATASHPVFAE